MSSLMPRAPMDRAIAKPYKERLSIRLKRETQRYPWSLELRPRALHEAFVARVARYQQLADVLDTKACLGDFWGIETPEAALYEDTYAERGLISQEKKCLTIYTLRSLV